MRRIEVYGLPQVVSPEMLSGKLVVVIDVLRATTVITNALANGADGILIARSVEEAKMLAATHNGLLAGERDAIMIEGFDFGNSPLEFTSDKIFRRKIVLTTTNGTSTLLSAGSGERLVAACFNNISSIVKFILHNRQDVVIICSGTNGKFSLDDALVAGTIICKLAKEQEFVPDDHVITSYSIHYTKLYDHRKNPVKKRVMVL